LRTHIGRDDRHVAFTARASTARKPQRLRLSRIGKKRRESALGGDGLQ